MGLGNGYFHYSISWNAIRAYEEGLLPTSKMVKYLKKRFPRTFRGLDTKIFKACVPVEEWHHTSKMYNETPFYSIQNVYEVRHVLKKVIHLKKEVDKKIKTIKEHHIDYVYYIDEKGVPQKYYSFNLFMDIYKDTFKYTGDSRRVLASLVRMNGILSETVICSGINMLYYQ